MYVSFIELSNNSLLIIGLNDVDNEGFYVWTDGSPVDYTNWGPNEPTGNPYLNYVRMTPDQWSDFGSIPEYYVCKYKLM